jgi:hypothetical protein
MRGSGPNSAMANRPRRHGPVHPGRRFEGTARLDLAGRLRLQQLSGLGERLATPHPIGIGALRRLTVAPSHNAPPSNRLRNRSSVKPRPLSGFRSGGTRRSAFGLSGRRKRGNSLMAPAAVRYAVLRAPPYLSLARNALPGKPFACTRLSKTWPTAGSERTPSRSRCKKRARAPG